MEVSKKRSNFALLLRGNPEANGDSLAQLVEHNTFNVGVVGSSPTRITNKTLKIKQLSNKDSCFFLFCSRQNRHGFTLTVNQDVKAHSKKPVYAE